MVGYPPPSERPVDELWYFMYDPYAKASKFVSTDRAGLPRFQEFRLSRKNGAARDGTGNRNR